MYEEKGKFILEGYINKKRMDAEKVCLFLNISEDRKYKL